MTKTDIAGLAFKLAGIYVLVNAADMLLSLGFMFGRMHDGWLIGIARFLGSGLSLALLVGGGLFLILKSAEMAQRVFPPTSSAGTAREDARETSDSPSLQDLQIVAFSIVGVCLVATSIPAVISSLFGSLLGFFKAGPVPYYSQSLVHGLLRLAIGLFLFFGAETLSRFFFRLRTAGRPTFQQPGAPGSE